MKETVFRAARSAWRTVLPEALRRRLGPPLSRLVTGRPQLPAATRGPDGLDPLLARIGPRFPRVPEMVSVVVPTLDAGPDFARSLARIGEQQGLGGLELIVVDSGSSDDTCAIAEDAGARVTRLPQGEFNHGLTRQRAMESARGDVVVMTVQDAALLARTAIRDLVLTLKENPRMAAVSARQVPRTDADLYGCFVVVSHHRAVWRNGRRVAQSPRSSAPDGRAAALVRRSLSTVDDVCAAIRRSAWEEVGFSELDFGEDLDFGRRAVESGWTLGLSESVAVAHSHRRDAAYHFRRGVAERLYIAPMVGDDTLSVAAHRPAAAVIASARPVIDEVEGALVAVDAEAEAPIVAQFDSLRAQLRAGPPRSAPPSGELGTLARLLASHDPGNAPEAAAAGELRQDLARVLGSGSLDEFVHANRAAPARDGHRFAAKLTAAALGRVLGDSLRRGGKRDPLADRLLAGV